MEIKAFTSPHALPVSQFGLVQPISAYKQYWYHYEEWRSGDRVTKKSRYIPKPLVARIEEMEVEKVSVKEILELLKSESRSKT